jgi:hypothetical protein
MSSPSFSPRVKCISFLSTLLNKDLLWRNLNDGEIRELSSSLLLLERERLEDSNMDERRWKLESSGVFSCKSFHILLVQLQFFLQQALSWKLRFPYGHSYRVACCAWEVEYLLCILGRLGWVDIIFKLLINFQRKFIWVYSHCLMAVKSWCSIFLLFFCIP